MNEPRDDIPRPRGPSGDPEASPDLAMTLADEGPADPAPQRDSIPPPPGSRAEVGAIIDASPTDRSEQGDHVADAGFAGGSSSDQGSPASVSDQLTVGVSGSERDHLLPTQAFDSAVVPSDDLDATVGIASSGSIPSPSARASDQPKRPVSGQLIPGYTIVSELGRGGMGVVYKAHQVALGRTVALKMVLAGAHAGPEQLARFYAEAQAIAHLRHPDIVQIYDIGEHEERPYFSLEYLEGGSLAQRIGGRPMPPRVAAEMLIVLSRAMHAAHQKGIIHRDLKPANVLLTEDGHPKITDFGLAKRLEGDSHQTRTGAIMGTPSYMAPEQAWGLTDEIGPKADQYALGAILYEMLTGRPPFQGATPLETLELARTQEPVPPTRLQPRIPRDLETICLKALQKEPHKRYPDVGALADDVQRYLDGKPILARPVSAPERLWRWCRRNQRVAALLALTAVSMVVATIASSVSAVRLADKNRQLDEKNLLLDKALAETEKGRQRAVSAEAAALKQKENAEKQKENAEAIAQLALKQSDFALNSLRFLSVLANQRLRTIANTQQVRAELLETAARDLKVAMEEMDRVTQKAGELKIGNAQLMEQTAIGIHLKTGQAFEEMGRLEEAGKQYAVMIERAEALAARYPDSLDSLQTLAYSQMALGDYLLTRAGKVHEAEDHYLRALELRRALLKRDVSDNRTRDLAQTLGALGRASLFNGDPSRARSYYEEELALREAVGSGLQHDLEMNRELAGLLEKLGEVCLRLRDPGRARAYFDRSLKLRENLSAQTEGQADAVQTTQRDVLLSLNRIGVMSLLQLNDPATARVYFERALEAFQQIAADDPENAVLKGDVAMAHYFVATAFLRMGEREIAEKHYRDCLKLRRQLMDRAGGGDLRIPKINLMVALARCGEHEEASRLAASLIERPPNNPHDYFQAACGYALCAGAVSRGRPVSKLSPDQASLVRRYTDQAFAALRQARAAGWRSVVDLELDPDLDPIRSDPGFAPLLDEFRQAGAPARASG
jgi:serine/threonine protein kinase